VRQLRDRQVVEADDRHVLRHPTAVQLQRLEGAGRHVVGRGRDGVDRGIALQQALHGPGAAVAREVGVLHERGVEVRTGQRVDDTAEPGDGCVGVGRPGDGRDAAAAEPDEVLGCDAAAVPVVDVDEPVGPAVQRSSPEHRRQAGLHHHALQGVVPAQRHDHHAVGAGTAQHAPDPVVPTLGVAQQQLEVELGALERRGHAHDHLAEEGVAEQLRVVVRGGEDDRTDLLARQGLCHHVGHVPQLADGPLDGQARGRADVDRVVDRARGGGPRDACAPRHLVEGGGPPGAPCHGSPRRRDDRREATTRAARARRAPGPSARSGGSLVRAMSSRSP